MANPNRTVAAFRNRKMWPIAEDIVSTKAEAEGKRDHFRAKHPDAVVKVARFRVGPRPCKANGFRQQYKFAVRAYTKL